MKQKKTIRLIHIQNTVAWQSIYSTGLHFLALNWIVRLESCERRILTMLGRAETSRTVAAVEKWRALMSSYPGFFCVLRFQQSGKVPREEDEQLVDLLSSVPTNANSISLPPRCDANYRNKTGKKKPDEKSLTQDPYIKNWKSTTRIRRQHAIHSFRKQIVSHI